MDLGVPYRTALKKATTLIRSPYSVWRKMPVREQHELFFFLFDEKIVYARNSGYRTSETTTAARLFEDFAAANSSTVDSAYKILNLLKSYLEDFWAFYQSNPALQRMLDEQPSTSS